jgi:tyrosyl-tRNA synthetase
MLAKESVQSRLARPDGGISYTEFSYMLLQAYDFMHLHRTHGCDLQVGGSDQWGNITAGIELARRMGERALHGLTVPLLTNRDGLKMGKTERGALWLSAERTSPYAFYQYWINCEDADVGTVLRMLTELPQDEVEALDAARAAHPERRESQRRLAESLTRLVHGEEGLAKAVRASEVLFGAVIERLSDDELADIFADVPSVTVARSLLDAGLPVADAFAEVRLAKSKSEARRMIAQGGAYVNNRRVESADAALTPADLAGDTTLVLRAGKKTYALLRVG